MSDRKDDMQEEEIRLRVTEAIERGRFEGQVLQSLSEIKSTLEKTDRKHVDFDTTIARKADRSDVEELKRRVWMMSGGAVVIGALLGQLL
jgi:flagellar biosynthesis/type III secretory pathway chaperone